MLTRACGRASGRCDRSGGGPVPGLSRRRHSGGSLVETSVQDASFDVVTSWEVLEHLRRPVLMDLLGAGVTLGFEARKP